MRQFSCETVHDHLEDRQECLVEAMEKYGSLVGAGKVANVYRGTGLCTLMCCAGIEAWKDVSGIVFQAVGTKIEMDNSCFLDGNLTAPRKVSLYHAWLRFGDGKRCLGAVDLTYKQIDGRFGLVLVMAADQETNYYHYQEQPTAWNVNQYVVEGIIRQHMQNYWLGWEELDFTYYDAWKRYQAIVQALQ